MKTVSVIIPNLHSPIIGEVIAAVRCQTAHAQIREIIVVGQDRYAQVQTDELVQFIRTPSPVNAATARNLGAQHSSGDYLLFLDADCIVEPTNVERLIDSAEQHPEYAALVAGVLPEQLNYWVLCSNMLAFYANLSDDQPGTRAFLPSCCMLVPRRAWEAGGGFDQSFGAASCEDIDLCYRWRKMGYQLGCEPRAHLFHRPTRRTLGAAWHNHAGYGYHWVRIRRMYPEYDRTPLLLRLINRLGKARGAATVPLAALDVARLVLHKRHMLRFWQTFPGLFLIRLAWYYGYWMAYEQHIPIAQKV